MEEKVLTLFEHGLNYEDSSFGSERTFYETSMIITWNRAHP